MKIYHYERVTGLFCGTSEADENPREKGKYLIPANATTKEPPEEKEGFTRNFNALEVYADRELMGSWGYVEIPKPEPEPEIEIHEVTDEKPENEKVS